MKKTAAAWKSEVCLVPQGHIKQFIPALFEAEKREWIESCSPVSGILATPVDGSETRETTNAGVGLQILRHGNIAKEIHAYFQRFESHRYRSILTNKKRKPCPDNTIKVVTNDSSTERETLIQEGIPGGRSHSSDPPFDEKSPDYVLYEKAMLCAMYPVLSTPSSPYSPSLSPTTSPTFGCSRRFSSFGIGRPSVSSPQSQGSQRRFSFTTERSCVSPEVSVPIDSEVLKELVRNTFGLNTKRQRFYMKNIERKNNQKPPERLLVEELLVQLSMLESNHHPFYRVQAFMDRNAYNEWLIQQKEKIQILMKRFWHHPQPAIPALPLNMTEKHTEYYQLMLRLIRHESTNKQIHPMHDNVTPSAPLSVETCRLLQEFGLRFGVGELYCKIIYLNYLVDYFENEMWYIEHVTAVIRSVMDLVPVSQEILVKQEFAMLLSLFGLLQKKTKHSLTRIKRLFPDNSPTGGVSGLVTLLVITVDAIDFLRSNFPNVFSTLLEARQFLEDIDDEPVDRLLSKYLKEEMEGRYERSKVRATDELNAQFLTHSVSPQLLNMLILNSRDEVNNYCNFYQQEFSRFLNIEELGATTFYKKLMSDVDELISIPCTPITQPDKVDVCLLSVAFRLSELDQDWEKYIPLSFQTWRQPFLLFANTWLDAIGCHLQRFVTMAIERDRWREVPVEVNESEDNKKKRSRKMRRGASSLMHSYPPLTPSKHSAFRVVQSPPDSTMKKDYMDNKRSKQNGGAATGAIRPRKSVRRAQANSPKSDDSSSISDNTPLSGIRTVVAQVHVHRAKSGTSEKESSTVQEAEQTSVKKSDGQTVDGLTEKTGSTRCDEQANGQTDVEKSKAHNDDNNDTCETERVKKSDSVDDDSDRSTLSQNDSDSTQYGSYSDSIHSSDCIEDHWVNNRQGVNPIDFTVEIDSTIKKPQPMNSQQGHHSGVGEKNEQTQQNEHRKAMHDSKTVEPPPFVHKTGPQLCPSSGDKLNRTKGLEEWSKRDCRSCPEKTSICREIEDGATPIEEKPTSHCKDSHKRRKLQQAQKEEKVHSASLDIPQSNIIKKINNTLFAGVTQTRHSDQSSLQSTTTEYESFQSTVGSFMTPCGTTPNSSSPTSIISNEERSSLEQSKSCDSSLESLAGVESGHVNSDNPRQGEAHSREGFSVTQQLVLPVSSSFVDVICVVNRLVSFACHLCKILCPDERPPRGDHPTPASATTDLDDMQSQSAAIKRELCHKLIQVLTSFLKLYTINVLRMDSCGLTQETLQYLVGNAALDDLHSVRGTTHCRYNRNPQLPCNTAHPTSGTLVPPCEALMRTKQMPGGCEPVTQQMGVRISNLVVLENLLPWIQNYVQASITHPDSLASGYYGNSMGSAKSWTYCQFGPSLAGRSGEAMATATAAGSEGETEYLCGSEEVRHCKEVLERLEVAQIKLVTYRINTFFNKVLQALLSLSLPSLEVHQQLKPALDFLTRELTCFNSVLYPVSFQKLLLDLWTLITQDFNEEVNSLKKMKSQAPEQAKLLLQATGLLMQFFHGQGEGLTLDTLSRSMEPVFKHLELYNTRTDRLIYMYRWLYRQVLVTQQQYRADEFVSSISIASHYSRASSPEDVLIQSLCQDLHTVRKCFSGAVFVDWIKDYVREHGYNNLGVYIGNNDTDTGVELGRYLLHRKLVVCVSAPPRDSEEMPEDMAEYDDDEGASQHGRQVYYPSDSPSERLNNITVTQPRPASSSTSRTTTTPRGYDTDDSDSGDLETDDIFHRTDSVSSEDTVFHNSPDAFYSFINDEEVNSGEFKFKLDFADRLNVEPRLMQIICVLHTRKETDSAAKSYLKKIPSGCVAEALEEKPTGSCFWRC